MDCTVDFTRNELLFLKDQLSIFMAGPNHGQGPYPELLLKIGAGLLEFHADPARDPLPIAILTDELWMIWEAAKSFATVGSEHVGYNLTIKAAEGLRTANADAQVHALITRFGETSREEPGKGDYREKLERVRGGGDYGREGDEPSATDRSPGGDTASGPGTTIRAG